jgi:hypothetical protein
MRLGRAASLFTATSGELLALIRALFARTKLLPRLRATYPRPPRAAMIVVPR